VGETSTQPCLNEDRIKNLVGGEAEDPSEREGIDRCVVLLGRSHQGRAEAGDNLTMISHSVEISIAGVVHEKDERKQIVLFLFCFFLLFIIYSLLRYKKSHGELPMAKTKHKIQNKLPKRKSITIHLQVGPVQVPGPHAGTQIKNVK